MLSKQQAGPRKHLRAVVHPRPLRKETPTLELITDRCSPPSTAFWAVTGCAGGRLQDRRDGHRVRRSRRRQDLRRAAAADQGADRCGEGRRRCDLSGSDWAAVASDRNYAPTAGDVSRRPHSAAISPGISAIARSASASSPRATSASSASRGDTPVRRGP